MPAHSGGAGQKSKFLDRDVVVCLGTAEAHSLRATTGSFAYIAPSQRGTGLLGSVI